MAPTTSTKTRGQKAAATRARNKKAGGSSGQTAGNSNRSTASRGTRSNSTRSQGWNPTPKQLAAFEQLVTMHTAQGPLIRTLRPLMNRTGGSAGAGTT